MNTNGKPNFIDERRYGLIEISKANFFQFIITGFPFPMGTAVIDVGREDDNFEVIVASPFFEPLQPHEQVPTYELMLAKHPAKPLETFFHGYKLKNKPMIHLPGRD